MTEPMPAPSGWNDHWLFLNRWLRSPRTVGAIAPSSSRLARSMLEGLALPSGVRVAELGPGTGAFTAEIVRRLPADGRCLAVDVDSVFVSTVRNRWARVECICEGAERLVELARARGLLPFDHIVSGLPFASLPKSTARSIADAIQQSLRAGGTFTTFQYVHAFAFPGAVAFRRLMTDRMGAAPMRRLVIPNIPPAFVVRWQRSP